MFVPLSELRTHSRALKKFLSRTGTGFTLIRHVYLGAPDHRVVSKTIKLNLWCPTGSVNLSLFSFSSSTIGVIN